MTPGREDDEQIDEWYCDREDEDEEGSWMGRKIAMR